MDEQQIERRVAWIEQLTSRVALLEQKIETKIESDKEIKEHLLKTISALEEAIDDMRMERAKEKGFYGGIMLVIGGAASLITFVLNKYLGG